MINFPPVQVMRQTGMLLTLSSSLLLAACQSTNNTAALDTTPSTPAETTQSEETLAADASNENTSGEETAAAAQQTQSGTTPAPETAQTTLASNTAPAAQCSIQLAGGPPAKPPRGADFGQAVAKNTGKSIQRSVIQQIGARLGGGLGAAAAGGLANATIRQEQDIKGVWMITDASQACACEVSIDSLYKLKGSGADSGFSKNRGCSSPLLQQVAAWTLGYSFTGYDSKLELKAKDKKTIIGTFNRDGIHYFSGALSDGTPVVLWRNGQTYNQLSKFK